jgi:tRNA-specific 2-thiouridylase
MAQYNDLTYLCTMKRVVVGLSGGVDSSVAAHLLIQEGYDVIGIFMRNWNDPEVTIGNECPWIDDANDAILVAEQLGIPFQVIDLSIDYKARIVDYMFAEYQAGRTPNPDILCNREIKFDLFLKAAESLGADYVATGHYCQRFEESRPNGQMVYHLRAGTDKNKDQSYFLCQLNQEQLAKALFPIGHLTKPQVRAIAEEAHLVTAAKKDSQGLCFIGKVKLPVFLQQQLQPKSGNIIEISAEHPVFDTGNNGIRYIAFPLKTGMGQVIGQHNGAHYYTVGQRKGLFVGGKEKPLFVIGTDVESNVVFVGQSDEHPGLYRSGILVQPTETHWVRDDLRMKVGEKRMYSARIRYRQPLEECTLTQTATGLQIVFDRPQRAIAAGQFVAWYQDDELIGSGVMN